MKIYHNTQIIDGKEVIMLYVDYPSEYEFSLDFDKIKKNALDLSSKVREYATKNFKNLTNDTTILILNGVALGTLITAALINKFDIKFSKNNNIKAPASLTQNLNNEDDKNENKIVEDSNENLEKSISVKENETKEVSSNTSAKNDEINTNSAQIVTQKTESKVIEAGNNDNNKNSLNANVAQNNNATTSTPQANNEKMVSLKLNSGNIISISLEDYVTGVVSAEMPAAFNTEALKAQAVAARTYALKRIASGNTLTATTTNQIYKTTSELQSMWGSSYDAYYSKVKNAVLATKGEYITYNGKYIDALYFSTSNGKTENAENVWKDAYPYLVSVDSPWDVGIPSYSGTKSVSMSTISEKLNVPLTSISQIKILDKTTGDRVKTISICDKIYTGVEIRTIFGLKSADFDISLNGNNIVFTTRGYGHGVGMSQYGANLMAKAGYNYRNILTHYYTGVTINSL